MAGPEPVLPCVAHDTHSVCQHSLSPACLGGLFFFFGLMYPSPDRRHLVDPFRTYRLCSSAPKPITLEAQGGRTQVPQPRTKPNRVTVQGPRGSWSRAPPQGASPCRVGAATLLNIDLNHGRSSDRTEVLSHLRPSWAPPRPPPLWELGSEESAGPSPGSPFPQ